MGKYIIGVDVGGTNTDAALLDLTKDGADAVISSHKATTGTDVTTGIEEAIRALVTSANIPLEEVASLMIGTTHFINAVVEGDASRLEPVAVLRLAAGNFTTATPPFVDFPPVLERIMNGHAAFISGGIQVDGSLIGKIKEDEVLDQARIIQEKGIRNIAVVGVYSPTDESYKQEDTVRDLLKKNLSEDVNVVCSREIAGIGLLARENATILNASIFRFANRTILGFKRAMSRLTLRCPLYLTSNAGQLLSSSEAMKYPVQVFSSGATNSIRGAAFISKSVDGNTRYVVDIGGTTTEVGCLLPSGFPRLASAFTEIARVRVNFAMPQVESIGLGGGSLVHHSDTKITIGPDSVGQALVSKAVCFGGDVLTATDILVSSGEASIGSRKPEVESSEIDAAKARIKKMLEDCIDRMKTSADLCHVLLVGGGSFLCPSALAGVAVIERPKHSEVANAIGAAVAEVGAAVEMIVDAEKKTDSLAILKEKAIAQAVSKGAKKDSIRIIEEEVAGLAYIDAKCKISVKVAGPLDYEQILNAAKTESEEDLAEGESYHERKEWKYDDSAAAPEARIVDFSTYTPNIGANRVWHISETDLYFLSIGCYIIGCAGGGTTYSKYLETRQLLRSGETMTIVDINDLPPDTHCPPLSGVGSPAVGAERPGGNAVLHALQTMEDHLKIKYGAMLSVEIGGGNGMEPLVWGSSKFYNLPTVDGDLMGRAFPSFEKITPFISAENINDLLPCCLSDGDGTNIIMTTSKDPGSVDKVLRAAVVTMGSAAGGVSRPLTGTQLRSVAIPKTHSLAWRLGRAVAIARSRATISTVSDDIIQEFGGSQSAGKIFAGKIVGVGQKLYKGHSYGNLVIQKLADYEREAGEATEDGIEQLSIPFMNENLVVEASYTSGEKKIIATVPDLIMVIDTLTGEAVGVPEYRYGLKVMVIVASAHPLWTSTKRALEIGGPTAFGYDLEFKPFGTFTEVKSVIDEYAPKQ
ncbi:hydantoinase [Phlyctema vagabunda]|uniref:Hydantoinase n=1 Tax=Phlyctema vagabunda TaxID=108571 RepID=A0ABR4P4Z5_9HELO